MTDNRMEAKPIPGERCRFCCDTSYLSVAGKAVVSSSTNSTASATSIIMSSTKEDSGEDGRSVKHARTFLGKRNATAWPKTR